MKGMAIDYKKPEKKVQFSFFKARIDDLERIDTEHTLQIAKMNGYIHHLEEERRWRKFSEEKPAHHQWIFVINPNRSRHASPIKSRRWDDGMKFDVEVQELYKVWIPQMEAPEE